MRTERHRLFTSLRGAVCLALVALACGCNGVNGHMSNRVGMMHFRQGNYTAARADFQQALAMSPGNPDYAHNLAAAMKRQGDVAGTEQVLRHALRVDPSHQPSYHSLAALLHETGRTADAHGLLDMYVATQPYNTAPHVEMAWLHRETGNFAAAEQSLRHALQVQPNNATAMAHLGQLYQDTGRPHQAVAMYQKSLYANWRQPQVQSRLAQLRPAIRRNMSQTTIASTAPGWGPAPAMAYGPPPQFAAQPGMMPPTVIAAQPQYAMPPVAAGQAPLRAYAATTVTRQPTLAVPPDQVQSATKYPDADPAHAPRVSAEPPVVEPR